MAMNKHGLLRKYGFHRPISGETWHLEPSSINRNEVKNSGEAGMEVYSGAFSSGTQQNNMSIASGKIKSESEGSSNIGVPENNLASSGNNIIENTQKQTDKVIEEKNVAKQTQIAKSGSGSNVNQLNNVSNNNIISSDNKFTIDDISILSEVKTGIA